MTIPEKITKSEWRWHRDLRLTQVYDRLTFGLLGTVVAIYAGAILAMLPIPLARFIYLIPLWYIVAVSFRLQPTDFTHPDWNTTVWLARWSGMVMAGLAPFWGWWQVAVDSRYCLVNVGVLCLVGFFFLFHLTGLSRMIAEEHGRPGVVKLAMVARLSIIYLLLAPVAALVMSVWYGHSAGHEVLFILGKLSFWQQQVLTVPVLLTIAVCWQLCQLRFWRDCPTEEVVP